MAGPAVACGLSLHESLTADDLERPREEQLPIRMGVHHGEPVVDSTGPIGCYLVQRPGATDAALMSSDAAFLGLQAVGVHVADRRRP